MGLFVGKETENGYEASLMHKLLRPKISGNRINGVGETEDRPATPIYHRTHKHPWFYPNMHFIIRQLWDRVLNDSLRRTTKILKKQKKGSLPLGPRSDATPEQLTQQLKQQALSYNACDVVSIAENHRNLYFDLDLQNVKHIQKYAVVLGAQMNYDELSKNLDAEEWQKKPPWKQKWKFVSREVMTVYANVHEAADALADWVRAQGYEAECLGGAMGSKINMVRAAVESGMGELGKHGSILNDQYGSNLRLAVVLTDMPIIADEPRELGAEEFCLNCQLCTTRCPPKAISDEKQLVRGVERWYVDFDKCIPYFNDTRGCGICIAVCPWSRPGIAPNASRKMLKKLARKRGESA